MEQYYTITEFAENAGVTVQAVYRRLKTDLTPFVAEQNGVKVLNAEALKLFKVKPASKENQELKELQDKIAEQETLINQLKEDKLALTEKLADNNEKLLQILTQQTQQSENYQVLIAQVQQSLIQLLPPVETPSKDLNEIDLNLNKPVKKPGFISRLFKRS